jgi:hypothetical protein
MAVMATVQTVGLAAVRALTLLLHLELRERVFLAKVTAAVRGLRLTELTHLKAAVAAQELLVVLEHMAFKLVTAA